MKSLLTISTASMRQNLDHCDVTYNKSQYEKFKDTLVSLQTQCRQCSDQCIYRKFLFCKIYLNKSSECLYDLIASVNLFCRTRNISNLLPFTIRTNSFTNLFLPNCINKWNKLNEKIKIGCYSVVLKTLYQFSQDQFFQRIWNS